MQTAEQSILERISISRGTTEPEQSAPTGNTEVVNVSEDAPIEDVVETEAIANEEVTTEIEESEAQTVETQDEETDLFYYDIDGEEVSSDQIKSWKNGHLMQDDYTRKSQVNAKKADDLDVRDKTLTNDQSKLSEQLLTLEAMIAEDELSSEALTELREYEPEQYINYLEKQSKRKDFLKEAKSSATPKSTVNVQEEQATLIRANPQWLNNGKATEAYTKDMDALTNYYADNGFSQPQIDAVNGNALIAQAVIEAARAKALGKTNAAIEKRVRKAPVSTRPRASVNGSNSLVDKAQKAFNKNPSVHNAAALRTAKRQINN